MGKSDIPQSYKMSPQDQRVFDRWLEANAIISLIFAVGFVLMALAGANSAGPRNTAVANNSKASDPAASEPRRGRAGTLSTNGVAARDTSLRP
jgi:hypothetical protein